MKSPGRTAISPLITADHYVARPSICLYRLLKPVRDDETAESPHPHARPATRAVILSSDLTRHAERPSTADQDRR